MGWEDWELKRAATSYACHRDRAEKYFLGDLFNGRRTAVLCYGVRDISGYLEWRWSTRHGGRHKGEDWRERRRVTLVIGTGLRNIFWGDLFYGRRTAVLCYGVRDDFFISRGG